MCLGPIGCMVTGKYLYVYLLNVFLYSLNLWNVRWCTTNNQTFNCLNLQIFGSGERIQQILKVPFISWRECKEKANFPAGFQVDLETQLCAGGEVG